MKYCYSCAQMRIADEKTIEAGTPSLVLMERAGQALAAATEEAMGRLKCDDVLFVCGGGNNGGDGFVAARLLREWGKEAEVLCLAEKFSPDCATVRKLFGEEYFGRIPRRRYALIVDCIFGTGLSRAPQGESALLIEFINNSGAYVIACDLPSGLAENGVAYSPCVNADQTVCMGLMKRALLMCDGVDVAGDITVADIGIAACGVGAEVWVGEDVAKYFPRKKSNCHKGMFGKAYLLAGGAEYSGAAFLAADACLKSGAGYTCLCADRTLFPYAVGKLPACVLRQYSAVDGEILSAECIAVGMGAGVSERLYATLVEILPVYTGTLVLDADAINTLSEYGAEILKGKACNVILTPHPKEFARLTGKSVKEVLGGAVEIAEQFAGEYGVTVVLKNNRTVITDGVRTAVNVTGSPALAKGGSGDVLAGFLAGTCARGVLPFEAACVAAYLCGKAGEFAAKRLGEYSVCAMDVIDSLPAAILEIVQ